MHATTVGIIGLILIVGLAAILRWRRQPHRGALAIAFVLALATVLAFPWVLWANPGLRVAWESRFRPVGVHVVHGEPAASLPLPPGTALRYRFAGDGAAYYTRTGLPQVLEFYRGLPEATVRQWVTQDQTAAITLGLRQLDFHLTLERHGQGTNLLIRAGGPARIQ